MKTTTTGNFKLAQALAKRSTCPSPKRVCEREHWFVLRARGSRVSIMTRGHKGKDGGEQARDTSRGHAQTDRGIYSNKQRLPSTSAPILPCQPTLAGSDVKGHATQTGEKTRRRPQDLTDIDRRRAPTASSVGGCHVIISQCHVIISQRRGCGCEPIRAGGTRFSPSRKRMP